MEKLTAQQLKNFVLETVNESRRPKTSKRSRELKRVMERAEKLLEKADPAKLDPTRFPQKLSDVAAMSDKAEDYSHGGKPDSDGAPDASDDSIEYEDKAEIASVQKLKPSQSSMNIPKALAFALGHIKSGTPGGHLGAFVSSDMFIMDGHHRWISSGMVDPDATLGGYLVDFPGRQLVAVLNNLTVGRFDKMEGKTGGGGFDEFTDDRIRAQLEEYLANGSGSGEFRLEPDDVQSLIEKFTGVQGDPAKDAAVKKFVDNLSKLTLETPAWAAVREDMPIIEKEDSEEARAAMAHGEIDVNPPYADVPEFADEEEKTNESKTTGDKVLLERWNRLAGIK